MTPATPIRKALSDPKLLGHALSGDSWAIWRTILIAIMGKSLTEIETELFKRFTGRLAAPVEPIREFWGVIGRRGGKSRAMAILAAYIATLCRVKLAPGEIGVVLCLAQVRDKAQIVLDYIEAALEGSPILRKLIRRRTTEAIELTNRIRIHVCAASFKATRGSTCVACIGDEIAFWPTDESINPDIEILAAVRPSLLTTRGPLIAISTPYARKGALWEAYRKHYGPDGAPDILVARGTSREFNPELDQADIDRQLAEDPERNSAEYLVEFRSDVASFINAEAVQACVDAGIRERPFSRMHSYTAFVDPSGGSSNSFTLGIAHKEGNTSVLDVVREHRPPFNAESVVEEYSSLLRQYQIYTIYGDKYAGEWPGQAFSRRGVTYEASERNKSELYRDVLPLINSKTAALLEHPLLQRQLVSLERRTARGGKDSIDHAPGSKDDVANAVVGALLMARERAGGDPKFWGKNRVTYPKSWEMVA